ncbi:MAG: DUF349 domain-containing protein [Imperialibacter sp.]|uniref:DUF349 domain-containing protein n=1 Tax=Imperialibacter sp. TaxID=2038411 RepID=UPI0032EFDAEB
MNNEKEVSEGDEKLSNAAPKEVSSDDSVTNNDSQPSVDVRDEDGKKEPEAETPAAEVPAVPDEAEQPPAEVVAEATPASVSADEAVVPEAEESQLKSEVASVEEMKSEEILKDVKEAEGPTAKEVETQSKEPTPESKQEAVAGEEASDDKKEKKEEPKVVAEAADASGDDEAEEEEDNEEHEEAEDYSHYSPEQLVDKFTEVLHWDDVRKADRIVRELKSVHDEMVAHDKEEALKKYLADGGEEDSFEFRLNDFAYRFEENYKLFREKKHKLFQNLEQQKEENYKKKIDVLEKLRHLVDGEENTTSITALKKIQDEWKVIGQVPGKYAKTLWANYNALIDRFYDNRSIYFELKELDRKKNLESKLELCDKAEALTKEENIKHAVKELNVLHEEFKHLGPVPKESQEEIWQRFKAASDLIYSKRREMVDELKVELKANMEVKTKLCEEAETFVTFNSDKINEWNKKTKEVLELQKRWEAVGGVPKESAKKINKRFWGAFKTFFSNKSGFFKTLEGKRHENLKLKEELVAKADALKDSEEWDSAANQLKQLQQQWREVGPVPEKVKEEVFRKFKAACDHFFERKRSQSKGAEKEYYDNLKKKEDICEQLLKLAGEKSLDLDIISGFQEKYSQIGFVPRNAMKTIQKKYQEAIDALNKAAESLPEDEQRKFKTAMQVGKIKSEPHGERKIYQKEGQVRRQIATLENDIAVWKNNLEFLASSRKADKLKADFDEKIVKAEEELDGLKEQLKVIHETS